MKTEITEQEFWSLIRLGVKDFSSYIMPNVRRLDCENNALTALPELPNVIRLDCENNDLTSLPELPNVVRLDCYSNALTSLPELPNVVRLDCYNNALTALQELPNVEVLDCSDNALTALPELPNIERLYCSNNPLTGDNYCVSETSGRSVYYIKNRNIVLAGCFWGSLEEFYKKGYKEEGKSWVKVFYEKNK